MAQLLILCVEWRLMSLEPIVRATLARNCVDGCLLVVQTMTVEE